MYLTRSTRSAVVAALAARGHDGTPPARGLHAVQYEGSDENTFTPWNRPPNEKKRSTKKRRDKRRQTKPGNARRGG